MACCLVCTQSLAQDTPVHHSRQSSQILTGRSCQIESNPMLSFMRISTASLAFAAVLAAPVITTASSPAAGRDLSPDQRQALFQARKAWAKDNHQRRLDLLQSQQRGIEAAASADALKACRRKMKKARKSLKQDYQAHMNKVRNQLGLPARTGNKRDAKGRKLQG